MFRITRKGPPPVAFVEAVAAGATYKALPSNAKDALRDRLKEDQGGRCAYCERHLREDHKTVLEHFHPQNMTGKGGSDCQLRVGSTDLSRSDVELGNLLLSCDGHKNDGGDLTCDASKSGSHICSDSFNPLNQTTPTLISVGRNGKASVMHYPGDQTAAQHVIDTVLNLNQRHLVGNRKEYYVSWLRRFQEIKAQDKGKTPARELRARFASKVRDTACTEVYPSTLESVAREIENRGA